jgi:hypothetical protein
VTGTAGIGTVRENGPIESPWRDAIGRTKALLFLEMRVDVVDGLLDSRYLFCVFVGNLGFEFFFEGHHELHGIQRIRTEIVDERRLRLDLSLIDTQLFGDDLLDSLFYVFHASPPQGDLNITNPAILPDAMQ